MITSIFVIIDKYDNTVTVIDKDDKSRKKFWYRFDESLVSISFCAGDTINDKVHSWQIYQWSPRASWLSNLEHFKNVCSMYSGSAITPEARCSYWQETELDDDTSTWCRKNLVFYNDEICVFIELHYTRESCLNIAIYIYMRTKDRDKRKNTLACTYTYDLRVECRA